MKTYQDLMAVGERDEDRIDFVKSAIEYHKGTDFYKNALIAQDYAKRRNTTIVTYQKLLYTLSGKAVPDNYSANYKLCSGFFKRFTTQQSQFLLGNGINWTEEGTSERLGENFDSRVQKAGRYALIDGVTFGFWNLDHLEIFRLTEFVPFRDELDGSLKAGIRFWQVDQEKPMRAVLYEMDGYTDFLYDSEGGHIVNPKRGYVALTRTTPAEGMEIYDYENYPSFPIVPLWANDEHQSELIGIRESIDAYDLIKSGFANDIDDASLIYWTISNAGGMDDVDLVKFVERMKTVKAAVVDDDGAKAEAHTIQIAYESREAILNRIRSDLYEDYMALDTKNLSAGGAITATQIEAAYEPLNEKTDLFEYNVIEFIKEILRLIGIKDNPTFTRSMIVNKQEEIQNVTQSAQHLSEEYVTKKILSILGDIDQIDEIMDQKEEEDRNRTPVIVPQEDDEEETNEDNE